MGIRLLFFLGVLFLVEYYFYSALKNVVSEKYRRYIFVAQVIWILVVIGFIFVIMAYRPRLWNDFFRIILSIIIITEVSKLFGSVFMLMDDLRRGVVAFLKLIRVLPDGLGGQGLSLSRSQFFSQLGVVFTFIPFAGFIYGIIRGGYNYRIHQVNLSFSELPFQFDGLKVVQISDLHLGSFFSTKPVEKIVEIVMSEEPDIIFFTGDFVNNMVEEALEYRFILSKLKAPLGVYSILGNHDYGDYIQWESKEVKKKNLERLIAFQRELGWDVLLNEHRVIQRDGGSMAVLGIENWGGSLHFPRYGDLKKAYFGTEEIGFKILLSHDPSHWDMQVSKEYEDIQLTLSGHTHGFQFGIEYGKLKYSPVQWIYKHWAGLYKKKSEKKMYASNEQLKYQKTSDQYLYVNRGVGFVGYPGRLGIWPEITVISLNTKY